MQQVKYLLVFLFLVQISIARASNISGKVFLDANKNRQLDAGEKGIKGICISNGNKVVLSGPDGEWELSAEKASSVFLVKPSGYQVPVDENQSPQHFFKINADAEEQTLNFALIPQEENKKFNALFFGDTQARGMEEVDYIFHDVVEELIGTSAKFGVSLGDIVADDPGLMDDVSAGIAQIGIPWYNVFGNHDNDRNAVNNDERDDAFERFFGPSTYAFEYGQVVFIALNNIFFNANGKYRPHFTEEQISFVKNYLHFVPKEKLVVLMMHAPIIGCGNKEELFAIIQDRQHSFSISGHVHEQLNVFVGKEMGWQGKEEHHHLVNVTVCGSWWCGVKDELGIPHATMNDGAPNGYSIINFDGNQYSIRFKAARRPADYQMNIYLPDEITRNALDTTTVIVNVFAGSERSVVEMNIGGIDEWLPLQKKDQIDPQSLVVHQLNPSLDKEIEGHKLDDIFGCQMDYPSISTHMWEGSLPGYLATGTHTLTVLTTDLFGQKWTAHRVFRVIE